MKDNNPDDIKETLQEVLEGVLSGPLGIYPKEAVPVGTWVRAIRFNKLGIVTDAFYGDVDKNGTKIIIYTIFMFPTKEPIVGIKEPESFFISNEYEYEVIAYLMMKPVNIRELAKNLGGNVLI